MARYNEWQPFPRFAKVNDMGGERPKMQAATDRWRRWLSRLWSRQIFHARACHYPNDIIRWGLVSLGLSLLRVGLDLRELGRQLLIEKLDELVPFFCQRPTQGNLGWTLRAVSAEVVIGAEALIPEAMHQPPDTGVGRPGHERGTVMR